MTSCGAAFLSSTTSIICMICNMINLTTCKSADQGLIPRHPISILPNIPKSSFSLLRGRLRLAPPLCYNYPSKIPPPCLFFRSSLSSDNHLTSRYQTSLQPHNHTTKPLLIPDIQPKQQCTTTTPPPPPLPTAPSSPASGAPRAQPASTARTGTARQSRQRADAGSGAPNRRCSRSARRRWGRGSAGRCCG